MRNLFITTLIILTVAIVAPELRTLLFVGAFCLIVGFMVGSQQTARHTAELHANRVARLTERVAQ